MSLIRRLVEAQWLENQESVRPVGEVWQKVRSEGAQKSFKALRYIDHLTLITLFSGGVWGASAMTGALLVNATQSVNALLMLALFVLIPILIKVLVLIVPNRRGSGAFQSHVLVARDFWAQLQLYSITSSVMTLLFWLLATDITFVWQSTLLAPTDSTAAALNLLALPWQWLIPSAQVSTELLVQSQHFSRDELSVSMAEAALWWPYLMAAMVVWGVLPRLLDVLWVRLKIVKEVRALERSANHQRIRRSELVKHDGINVQAPLQSSADQSKAPTDATIFSWRSGTSTDLAAKDFSQAQVLLRSASSVLCIHIDAATTPTAELADLLDGCQAGWLVLHSADNQNDLLSWQQFQAKYLPHWQLEY